MPGLCHTERDQRRGWIIPSAVIVLLIVLYLLVSPSGLRTPVGPDGSDDDPDLAADGREKEIDFGRARRAMVEFQLAGRDITDPRVLEVMGRVPRHAFIPRHAESAYGDHPLPIGHGQTISQPYIVALMTQSLMLEPSSRVLEIGTGSGYQAAVLAGLVKEVYSIEIVPELAEWAAAALREQGCDNVRVKCGDGYDGWPEEAPFDAVIVTAAAATIPRPLIDQLRDGGRLIIPLGDPGWSQTLTLLTRNGERLETTRTIAVRFVPLTGKQLEETD